MRRPIRRPIHRPIRRRGVVGPTLATIVCTVLAGGLAVVPGSPAVHADGVSDQQQQVKDDLAEIERLEQKSAQLNEEYLGYLNEKAALEAEITVSQQQIDAQQVQLTALQSQLAAVAVQQFTGGGGSALGLFGDTASATDSLQRDQLVRTAVNAGAASTDDYETLLDDLDTAHQDLQAKQDKVAKLADQAAETLDRTTQAGLDYQAELARDQATLGDLLAQEQARQVAEAAAQHAAEVAQAQADQQAAADRATAAQATPKTTGSGSSTANTSSTGNTSSAGSSGAGSGATAGAGDSGDASFGAAATVDTTPAAVAETSTGGNDSTANDSSNATSTPVDTAPPVSSRAQVAVAAARSQLGVPYRFAMSSPGVAFDCSGLTAYAWEQAGVSIPHQSGMQFGSTPHVPLADIQPGDLLFFYTPISHVSIYIGNGMEIHAPAPGKFVELASVNWAKIVGASRPG